MADAPIADLPQPAFGSYLQHFYLPDPSHPISRQAYEAKLVASDLVVLEINEVFPTQTVTDLSTFLDETFTNDISFAAGGNSDAHVQSGFSQQEALGRWTDGPEASLVFSFPSPVQNYRLTASVDPFLYGSHTCQRVEILVNGKSCGHDELDTIGSHALTAIFQSASQVVVTFRLPDAMSPAELGVGNDRRKLALAFRSLKFSPLNDEKR
jgi:hypothetical protein